MRSQIVVKQCYRFTLILNVLLDIKWYLVMMAKALMKIIVKAMAEGQTKKIRKRRKNMTKKIQNQKTSIVIGIKRYLFFQIQILHYFVS